MSAVAPTTAITWKVGDPNPPELRSQNAFLSTLIPRPLAWLVVDDGMVSLLNGYTAASYTPPTILCAATAIPAAQRKLLKERKVCTLSSVTVRDDMAVLKKVDVSSPPTAFSHNEVGLSVFKMKDDYPMVVVSSPVHMFCRVDRFVDLGDGEELLILTVEIFRISGSILSPPTEEMKQRPGVLAKIDASLIQPVVSLGDGRFAPLSAVYSLHRPKKAEDGSWLSSAFTPSPEVLSNGEDYQPMEWSYHEYGASSPLGYNTTLALIMPRMIGWISTYRQEGRIAHLAPYSFFTDVARGNHPHVAFSAYRKPGNIRKDAHLNAEEGRCFVYNMTKQGLVVAVNLSAAEMERTESEFELAQLVPGQATLVDAPVIQEAPVRYECEYVQTVDIGDFSIVVGKVLGISINPDVLTDGLLDMNKLQPITRLGFMDEYGTLTT